MMGIFLSAAITVIVLAVLFYFIPLWKNRTEAYFLLFIALFIAIATFAVIKLTTFIIGLLLFFLLLLLFTIIATLLFRKEHALLDTGKELVPIVPKLEKPVSETADQPITMLNPESIGPILEKRQLEGIEGKAEDFAFEKIAVDNEHQEVNAEALAEQLVEIEGKEAGEEVNKDLLNFTVERTLLVDIDPLEQDSDKNKEEPRFINDDADLHVLDIEAVEQIELPSNEEAFEIEVKQAEDNSDDEYLLLKQRKKLFAELERE